MALTEEDFRALAEQARAKLWSFDNGEWYIIPVMAIVIFFYAKEVKKARETKDWSAVCAGLALFGMDFINEMWNSIVYNLTGYAAFWMTPGDSTFITTVGWNLEIMFMFGFAGIAFAYVLPDDKEQKLFGINNRWALAFGFGCFATFVECLLNISNMLIWPYPWWNLSWTGIWLIFLIGHFPFYVQAFRVYDKPTLKEKKTTLLKVYGIAFALMVVAIILGVMYVPA